MAKYGISQEGVNALNQLFRDMTQGYNNIKESGRILKEKITGLGDGLGIYEGEIIDLVDKVNNVQKKGSESLVVLSVKVKELANQISELLNSGLG